MASIAHCVFKLELLFTMTVTPFTYSRGVSITNVSYNLSHEGGGTKLQDILHEPFISDNTLNLGYHDKIMMKLALVHKNGKRFSDV